MGCEQELDHSMFDIYADSVDEFTFTIYSIKFPRVSTLLLRQGQLLLLRMSHTSVWFTHTFHSVHHVKLLSNVLA